MRKRHIKSYRITVNRTLWPLISYVSIRCKQMTSVKIWSEENVHHVIIRIWVSTQVSTRFAHEVIAFPSCISKVVDLAKIAKKVTFMGPFFLLFRALMTWIHWTPIILVPPPRRVHSNFGCIWPSKLACFFYGWNGYSSIHRRWGEIDRRVIFV